MADIPASILSTATVTGISQNGGIIAGSFAGDVEVNGDHDWVRVDLVAGQQYQFFVSLEGPSNDSQLVLRDPAGNQILSDDDAGAGANSYTAFTPLVSGAYFVDVGEFGNNATGAYTLEVVNNTAQPGTLKFLDADMQNYSALAGERVLGGAGNDTLSLSADGRDAFGEQGNDYLVGNELKNTLSGGTGNDFIIGNGGMDVLFGGSGNDTMTGGEYSDVITPGEAPDTLIGGAGDDEYVDVDGNDTVIELAGEGYDSYFTHFSVTLQDSQSIERIQLSNDANINATGNASNNSLNGNSGNNRLDGAGGDDYMFGGAGNDTFVVDSTGDVVAEDANEGTDTIESFEDFSLAAIDNIENILLLGDKEHSATGNGLANALTGNSANNSLSGGAGDDTLSGAGGNDMLTGGSGNDTYVNPQADTIIELANGGTDTVRSGATFTLSGRQQVENLTLTGAGDINGSGNSYDNVLTGNTGNNILNGSTGADTMIGGAGNDIYYVDTAGDVTTEAFNQGIDIVSSSISRTLSVNIENLNLNGTADIDGNGNTAANIINGNDGDNILRGYEGGDTLNGKAGEDILLGGTSSDYLNPGADAMKDIIRFSAVSDSTGSQRDIVTGMDLNAEDVFDFTVMPTSLAYVGGGTLSLATINADLAMAVNGALAANGAVLFDPNAGDLNDAGHLFVVVDGNGDGVYTANQDYVVELVNATGTLTLDDFI